MKKLFSLMLAAIMMLALCAGCAQSVQNDGARDEITIGTMYEWLGTDLYQVLNIPQGANLMADSLIRFDPETGEAIDNIATGLTISDDNLTVTLTIPEGMAFPDGSSLDPEDVKASVEWGQEVSDYNFLYMCVESMDIDGRDIIFHLSEYSSTFLYTLATNSLSIIDSKQLQSMTKDDLLWGAIPYGPYSVTEYVEGSHVTLTRNPNYKTSSPTLENKGEAYVETVTFRFFSEAFSLRTSLEAGEIDMALGLNSDNIDQLDAESFNVTKIATSGCAYLQLNKQSAVLSDTNVRKAVALALDRSEIVAAVGSSFVPSYALVTPEILYYSAEAEEYFRTNYADNIDEAKQLMADAGWADSDGDGYLERDGGICEVDYIGYEGSDLRMQVIQTQLKAIGIKANIEVLDGNYLYERLGEDDYDIADCSMTWYEAGMYMLYLLDDMNNLDDDTYYGIVAEMSATSDSETAVQLVYDASKILYDELIAIPTVSEAAQIACSKELTGIVFVSADTFLFNDVK